MLSINKLGVGIWLTSIRKSAKIGLRTIANLWRNEKFMTNVMSTYHSGNYSK